MTSMYGRRRRHTEGCPDRASFKRRTLIGHSVKAMSLCVLIFCDNQKVVKHVVDNTTGRLLYN